MNGELKIGAILHYRNFEFEDGETRNKYMVVLGAKPGCDYLCALTTSQQWLMKSQAGCHHKPRSHFFIPAGGKNFFPKDTWIVLSKVVIMSRADVLAKGLGKIIDVVGNLNPNISGQIRNCLKNSKDIRVVDKKLL